MLCVGQIKLLHCHSFISQSKRTRTRHTCASGSAAVYQQVSKDLWPFFLRRGGRIQPSLGTFGYCKTVAVSVTLAKARAVLSFCNTLVLGCCTIWTLQDLSRLPSRYLFARRPAMSGSFASHGCCRPMKSNLQLASRLQCTRMDSYSSLTLGCTLLLGRIRRLQTRLFTDSFFC